MTDISRLAEVVEDYRQQAFNDLDPELVQAVLRIHADHIDDPVTARRKTDEAVRSWVDRSIDT